MKKNWQRWGRISGAFNLKKNYAPPLVPLALMLCLGILTANQWPPPGTVGWLLGAVGLVILVRLLKRKSSGGFQWIFFFLWGMVLVHQAHAPPPGENHILTLAGDEKIWVLGRVSTLFPEAGKRVSITLDVIRAAKAPDKMRPASGRLRLTLRNMDKILSWQDTVQVRGRVRPFRNFANPGGFDYARYMARKGMEGAMYARANALVGVPDGGDTPWITPLVRWIARLRRDFSRHIDATVADPDAAAMVNALVLGRRQALSTALQQVFSRCGISHVLAISGLHLSIVAGLFFFLFRWVLGLFPPLLVRGLHRRAAALPTLLPLVAYAVVSGFSPATQRALIMVTVLMFSLVAERENMPLNALAAACILILSVHPHGLFSISFQLSFMAVLFIIAGLGLARYHGFPAFGRPVLNRITVFFLVSLLAVAGTQPLVMRYFNMISFIGVGANAVAIPGIGLGVLPLGLAALLLFPLFPALSGAFLVAAREVARPCMGLFHWLSRQEGTWCRTITPDFWYLGAWYLFMGAIYLILRARGRGRKVGVVLAAVALGMGGIHGAQDFHKRFFSPDLDITVLDVGQGNSALVRLPWGRCFLVDGGGFGGNGVFDTGRHLVAPFLWRNHILTLDGVVLSHPEADHMNGLIFILENFTVKVLYKNGDHRKTRAYGRLMALARSRGTVVHQVDLTGETIAMPSGGVVRFFPAGADMETRKGYNNNSLVLAVAFQKFSMLFPGDIMAAREADLVRQVPELPGFTWVMVPHHGSGTSSTQTFLAWARPEMAVVSCGWHNRFHFPHARVVRRYERHHIGLLRTDRDGAVCIHSDGVAWTVSTIRSVGSPVRCLSCP